MDPLGRTKSFGRNGARCAYFITRTRAGSRVDCEKRDKKGGAVFETIERVYTSSWNSACLRTINCLLFFGVTRPRHEKQEARKVDRFGNSLYVAPDRKESREIEFARTYDTQEREGRERSGVWEGEIKTSPEGERCWNDQNALDPSPVYTSPLDPSPL